MAKNESRYPPEKCRQPDCDGLIEIQASACPTCSEPVEASNVRMARYKKELEALLVRFEKGRSKAIADGLEAECAKLDAIASQSFPVINDSPEQLLSFLTWDRSLYASYQKQVSAGLRKASKFENHQNRRNAENTLFGDFGDKIAYAALSPDGRGLISYGEASIRLKLSAIARRSSLLSENSYFFLERHKVQAIDPKLPWGYRSTWEDKSKLAIAKLADKLVKGMSDDEISHKILASNGDRALDEFIEIHIFGTFDAKAVDAVYLPEIIPNKRLRQRLKNLENKARELKIEIHRV